MDGLKDGWMDEWRNGLMDGGMEEWIDGWMDGWMDGWIIIPSVTRTMIDCGANEADDQRNYKPLKKTFPI